LTIKDKPKRNNESEGVTIMDALLNMWSSMAFHNLYWGNFVMWGIAFLFIYLAVKKDFEALCYLPIAFGILLVNLPQR
jgi:oxaloacetate decarboxylase beta subunit